MSTTSIYLINVLEEAEELSDRLFIPRIGRDDGVVLYTLTYLIADPNTRFVAIELELV